MSRCTLCPGVNACIGPDIGMAVDGPSYANALFIGEAPGPNENRKREVFVGKTGEEVNRHYLPLAGMRRDSVIITNAIRCLPTSAGGKLDANRRKDLELLESCATHHLYPLIESLQPRVLVPMGAFACRAVCPGINLELQHGYPVETAWGIPAFPMYHPALGIHEPKKMLYIRTDWQRLRRFLSGTLTLPHDPYPEPDYREVTDAREIVEELDPTQPLAGDTESTRRHEPFCLTYSQSPGTGRLIRAGHDDLLQAFQAKLDDWEAPIVFHHWLYDWPVTAAMGLQFPRHRLVDSMVRTYHLGNLPQGLKALGLRELGMEMQDFDDLVTPYSTALVLKYYREAYDEDWSKPPEQVVRNQEGKWELYRPQSMKTKLKRFFTDYRNNEEKDVFKMWEKNWVEEQGAIEEKCGEWPGKCITHVPFDEALFYACRDSDALIRYWDILRRMPAHVRHYSQDHWREKVA